MPGGRPVTDFVTRDGAPRTTPGFALHQKVYDAFRDIEAHLREHEMIVAVHPDDLTDELRRMIEATPLTTLRETKFIKRGQLYVIHPGLLGDLNGR